MRKRNVEREIRQTRHMERDGTPKFPKGEFDRNESHIKLTKPKEKCQQIQPKQA